jgi:hypothetical protein
MMTREVQNNFYIFVTKRKHFQTSLKHLVYPAKITRPEHRALANVKKGDMCFIYEMDSRIMYGLFEVEDRIFEDPTDVGFEKNWPHRIPIRLWGQFVGELPEDRLVRFFSQELVTVHELSDLHRKYLNPLLYEEGQKLITFFTKHSKNKTPKEVCSEWGKSPIRKPTLDARALLHSGKREEYIVELYLLQNLDKLEEIVGSKISEVYNQIYGYRNRFLDILTIHRTTNLLKSTVIEIKPDPSRLEEGLDELTHYMQWVNDYIVKDPALTFGIFLTQMPKSPDIERFRSISKEKSSHLGLLPERINWVGYEIVDSDLLFAPIC